MDARYIYIYIYIYIHTHTHTHTHTYIYIYIYIYLQCLILCCYYFTFSFSFQVSSWQPQNVPSSPISCLSILLTSWLCIIRFPFFIMTLLNLPFVSNSFLLCHCCHMISLILLQNFLLSYFLNSYLLHSFLDFYQYSQTGLLYILFSLFLQNSVPHEPTGCTIFY